MYDALEACPADACTCEEEDDGEEDCGNAFEAFVPIWMGFIGFAIGEFDANHYDECGEHIGEGVDGICDGGGGVADDSCD